MGRFDSSRSRVAPVFDRLRAIHHTGRSWLPTLLSLPAREPRVTVEPSSGPLKKACWWPEEERLPAPKELLRRLVQNAAAPQSDAAWGGEQTKQKRMSLTHHDPNVIAEAMKLLDRAAAVDERAWYVLEGPSCPDVFGDYHLVVVIEGKRTERHPPRLRPGCRFAIKCCGTSTPRGPGEAIASFSAFSLSKVTRVTA